MALTQVKTTGIADDAVTEAKVANDAIGTAEMKAGTDGHIITYDASGNPTTVGPGTDGQVLTSTGAGSPPAFETLPASNNYVHPNHSGEVTSTADGAQVIADDVVDEANLKVSNSPTNGYFLSAQSGNTGGLTWAAVSSDTDIDFALWRINTGWSGNTDPVQNFTEQNHSVDMGYSSGIFSFPSTGFWFIEFQTYMYYNSDQDNIELHLLTTTNDSSYATRAQSYTHMNNDDGGNLYSTNRVSHIFDVSDTSNHKVKFKTAGTSANFHASSSSNESYAIFWKLGAT